MAGIMGNRIDAAGKIIMVAVNTDEAELAFSNIVVTEYGK